MLLLDSQTHSEFVKTKSRAKLGPIVKGRHLNLVTSVEKRVNGQLRAAPNATSPFISDRSQNSVEVLSSRGQGMALKPPHYGQAVSMEPGSLVQRKQDDILRRQTEADDPDDYSDQFQAA